MKRPKIFREGEENDEWEIGDGADCVDGDRRLGEVALRLHDQEIDAPLHQTLRLLAVSIEGIFAIDRAERRYRLPERPNRAGDESRLPDFLPRVPRQPRTFSRDDPRPIGDSVRGQAEAIGAEGVRFDHFGPGAEIFAVDRLDQPGIGEIERVKGAVERHPLVVQKRPHRPVGQHRTAGEAFDERMHGARAFGDVRPGGFYHGKHRTILLGSSLTCF